MADEEGEEGWVDGVGGVGGRGDRGEGRRAVYSLVKVRNPAALRGGWRGEVCEMVVMLCVRLTSSE